MKTMKITRRELGIGAAVLATAAAVKLAFSGPASPAEANAAEGRFAVRLTPAEWKERLTPMQYYVLREEGTEHAFTSPLNEEHRAGIFACAGCDLPLFSSKTKFDSGTGWPSFWAPIEGAVEQSRDDKLGFLREEVHCSRCGGHLGHVFEDGPKPTGLRYCINGVALKFDPGKPA